MVTPAEPVKNETPEELGELSADEITLIASLREGKVAEAYHPHHRLRAAGMPDTWTPERAISVHIISALALDERLSDDIFVNDDLHYVVDLVVVALTEGLQRFYFEGDLRQIHRDAGYGQAYSHKQETAHHG